MEEKRSEEKNEEAASLFLVEALPAQLRRYLELRTATCFIEYYTGKFQE